jgi:hypothetical protein
LKEKFLLNFHGFQVELDTEKDFLSCTQHGKETLPNFYRRFLQLKGKNLEVSNDQVITQSIKALQDEPLHNHLVRDWPKTCQNSKQFAKFNKSKVQDFRKLEQQRKTPKQDKTPMPCYNDNQCNYPKPVHNIDSDGCEPPEN